MAKIKDLPIHKRPREKLSEKGSREFKRCRAFGNFDQNRQSRQKRFGYCQRHSQKIPFIKIINGI